MKKYFILISAVIFAMACTKELTGNQEAYNGEYKTITFESIATKTTIDMTNGRVAWEAGDEISIYYLADGQAKTAVATATAEGAEVLFTAQIPVEHNPTEYYAAYPKETGVLDPSTGKFYLNIKNSICDGTFKSANFSASYTSADVRSLPFHNAVGMIKLAIPEGGQFSKDGVNYKLSGVYMRGQSGAFNGKNNNGPVKFNPSDATFGDPVDLTVGETKYGDGDANINMPKLSEEALASGYVYIPSLPGTWPTGLCVRYLADVEDTKGAALPAVLSKPEEVEIQRGQIRTLADQTSKITFNYYVSPNGEGDGLTVAKPMSLAKMQEMITATSSYIFNAFLLDKVVFNLADGTYELGSTLTIPTPKDSYKLTIKGNAGAAILEGGNTLSGSGADALYTSSNNGKQIMNVSSDTKVLLKGLTFQNGYATNGAAIMVSFGANSTDTDSILDVEDCKFNNNISQSTGGAVMVSGNATGGQVRFNNCYFGLNESLDDNTGGGAVGTNGSAAVMFNKCTFYKNKSGRDAFDILTAKTKPRVGVNNCTFNVWNNATRTNGASITSRGSTVIANTTVWSSGNVGMWGSVALGAEPSTNGAENAPNSSLVINSYLRNKTTSYGAFYLHNLYYQNIAYCIYSGSITPSKNTAVEGTHYTLSNSYDSGIGGTNVSGASNKTNQVINGVPHQYYVWTWSESYKAGFSCPTLAQVRTAIGATPGIGNVFLSWLDSIDGALDTDIMGNPRTLDASCPGSYQQKDTPVGQ